MQRLDARVGSLTVSFVAVGALRHESAWYSGLSGLYGRLTPHGDNSREKDSTPGPHGPLLPARPLEVARRMLAITCEGAHDPPNDDSRTRIPEERSKSYLRSSSRSIRSTPRTPRPTTC
jgi:hypothetical protein